MATLVVLGASCAILPPSDLRVNHLPLSSQERDD
jgi:hypothetical protein